MMLKRLRIFEFSVELTNPCKQEACGRCFASLVLSGGAPAVVATPVAQQGAKRSTTSATGLTPDRKKQCIDSWSVDDVCTFLGSLSLGHVELAFRNNGVDGMMLSTLSLEDLENELGLTKLQARKILARLPS